MSSDIFYCSVPIMSKSFYDMIPFSNEIIYFGVDKKFRFRYWGTVPQLEPISKTRLSAHGFVADWLKMLIYYRVCCAFSPIRA